MAMTAHFVQVSADCLARLQDDPTGTEDLFTAVAPASNLPPRSADRLSNLATGGIADAQGQGASLSSISIGKSWHGIHYLLCAKAQPTAALLSQAIMGGTELGEDFSGYGPARYFGADQTAAMSLELSRGNLETDMLARFNPAKMTKLGIYPNQWAGPDAHWLMREFRVVRDFYSAAAATGLAVVTCLV
jgi:hypothetical protein